MRDLLIGYVFISVAMIVFLISVFLRKQKLSRKIQDLQEELKDTRRS